MSNELHEGENIREYEVIWIKNGLLHREDGPAIEHSIGYSAWYLKGKKHRIDGPALIWINGDKEWWVNDELHREDGPAVEHSDGFTAWYLNDIQITEEKYNQWLTKKKLHDKLQSSLAASHTEKRGKI